MLIKDSTSHTSFAQSSTTGVVFDIQKFSVNDGPGVRTAVFMKGCQMRCVWCHNPESLSAQKQLAFNADKCVSCRRCEQVCPNNVHSLMLKVTTMLILKLAKPVVNALMLVCKMHSRSMGRR